jgi:stalled ribosome rescue protein Dom34
MNNKIGIWIDKKNAYLVKFENDQVNVEILNSEIDDFHPKGGTRSKTAYGPMQTVKEKTYLEKEKNDKASFFKQIVSKINNADYLYIIGPAQMKTELAKYVAELNNFKPNVLGVESADSMTENQIVATLKSAFRDLK